MQIESWSSVDKPSHLTFLPTGIYIIFSATAKAIPFHLLQKKNCLVFLAFFVNEDIFGNNYNNVMTGSEK